MKNPVLIILLSLPMLFSCEKVKEILSSTTVEEESRAPHALTISDTIVADSVTKKRVPAIAADSVALRIAFLDAVGTPLKSPIPITFVDEGASETVMTDAKGMIRKMVKSDHVVTLRFGEDEIINYFDMKGGETLDDRIHLNILPMRGRIMDSDGVPLQRMPFHIHYRYDRKDRTQGCTSDQVVYTDTLGYYKTYVTADFHSMVLRSSGFTFGIVPKREFTEFPVQNFLFEPFEVENRCAYNVPSHQIALEIPFSEGYSESVAWGDWSNLFAMDEALESSETIKVKLSFAKKSYTYKLKKKSGVFRSPLFRVCLK